MRLARDGEKFLALDGKTYSLKPDNCVIADQERAVGIGGVMGGEETGVTDSTKNILLEAAYFLPASIRRTARDLNLQSDASYRFERGVDPDMILRASQRAAELMGEIAGGTPAKEIHVAGELPADPADVSLSYEKCSRVIGVAIDPKTVDEILTRFGLRKTAGTNKSATWKIPSYRRDLQRDVDLIEEVLRAYGIDKIPGRTRGRFMPTSAADRSHDVETLFLRDRLTGSGLSEVRTSKLISRSAMAFEQSDRVTQSAKRRSRRAAAKLDQRFARRARTKHSCRSRECFHFRNRPCIHSAIWKRRTASWNFVVGKCRERTELAITDKAQPRLV